jgi:O-succinylbenzoic acid--CoA ligase
MPLCHIGGQAIVFRASQYGIAIILQERFEMQEVIYALENQKVTLVSLVPTMLRRLLGRYEDWQMTSSLRCILLGGAAASEQLLAECVEMNLPVYLTYGLTEACSQVTTATPQLLAGKPGSVGKPLMFSELTVADEAGKALPSGGIGEILVSGPTVTQGYYKREADTANTLAGGALHTGDLGYFDEDGDLWLVNRRSDLIISGGENVYPAEVERVLLRHPRISQACVVGLEDEEWGQVVAAAVVADPLQITQEEIIEFARQYLAGYKLPRVIRSFDQLPETASGKVLRRKVAEQLEKSPVIN